MQDPTDTELLRQYAHRNSDEAFAALVARHVNMVYSAALRKTGNPNAAEEITQAVFIILAKKADRLHGRTILSGWLYQTARLTAAGFLRTEIRRARREREAYMQSLPNETEPKIWPQIMPLLEDAMGRLGEKDRNAIALRFFEGKSFQEIGTAFGASENAAKKRVAYALEKLRKHFFKHGVSSTTATLAGAISTNSVQAAPVVLAKTVTATAIVKGAAASGSTLTLVKGTINIMAWTKTKTAVVIGIAALLAAGTTTVLIKEKSRNSEEVEHYFRTIGMPMTNGVWSGFDKIPANLFVLRKTHYADFHTANGMSGTSSNDRAIGRGLDFSSLMEFAYDFHPLPNGTRIVLPADAPQDRYDFLTTGPDALPKLQSKIASQLGYTASKKMRNADAYVLTIENTNAPGLKLNNGHPPRENWSDLSKGFNDPLASFLESHFNLPVVNQTGLGLEHVSFTGLTWDYTLEDESRAKFRQYLSHQFGLELVKTNIPIEMLVVEKVK